MPTEPQIRDRELRSQVRKRIKNGRLPLILSKDVAAGYGSGKNTCAACDQLITRDHIEYEVEDSRIPVPLAFHPGCHAVWQIECAMRLTHGCSLALEESRRPLLQQSTTGRAALIPPHNSDSSAISLQILASGKSDSPRMCAPR